MSGSRNAHNRRAQNAGRPVLKAVSPSARAQRTSKAKSRSKHASSFLILLGLGLTSAVVFGLVLVNIALAQSSFELGDVQTQIAEQRSRQRQLRFEVAKSESPDRIAQVGAQLGLIAPEIQEFLQGPSVLASNVEPDGFPAGDELTSEGP